MSTYLKGMHELVLSGYQSYRNLIPPIKKNLDFLPAVAELILLRGCVVFWPFDPAKKAIQGDAPEGSDTF